MRRLLVINPNTSQSVSTLLQTRVADGIPPAQALAELLLALAPLQPGQGLAALQL